MLFYTPLQNESRICGDCLARRSECWATARRRSASTVVRRETRKLTIEGAAEFEAYDKSRQRARRNSARQGHSVANRRRRFGEALCWNFFLHRVYSTLVCIQYSGRDCGLETFAQVDMLEKDFGGMVVLQVSSLLTACESGPCGPGSMEPVKSCNRHSARTR